MTKGPIPDETPSNLQEQLLLEDAKAGNAIPIQGGADDLLGDAPRLVALYGGQPENWFKMTSTQAFVINGASVQVHWFQNNQTGQNVEIKFKRLYPKTAPKNQ
ncbi:MAG: hypothetical protein KME26_30985 [Oscillatoria princeps RMCB-10]|jgi:hypothetical protein|nr:hypothetical protein [Oscillatoria princeps RMCB-10]